MVPSDPLPRLRPHHPAPGPHPLAGGGALRPAGVAVKAITLWQPWASLIALGHKKHETRSWPTSYRGPLAIHAAKRPIDFDTRAWLAQLSELYQGIDIPVDDESYPLGVIVCTCKLVAVHSTLEAYQKVSIVDASFGDYTPGRYAWELSDVQKLEPPIPVRGAQGLWEWIQPLSERSNK